MFLEDIIGLMKATIIFPNNLFTDKSVLDKKNKIYLFQDPLFFQDLKYPVKFNKKKIFMHLLSMEEYYNNLISLGYDAELVHFYKLNGFDVIKNKTCQLVRDSSGVFVHASTSISFPIIYRKPIFFIIR